MDPAYSYVTLLTRLGTRFHYDLLPHGRKSLVIGLCFAKPTSSLAKSDILPQIPDWHHRSGNAADFYFPGYSDREWDDSFSKVDLPGRGVWYYSPSAFDEFRRDVEVRTTWKYSGGSDLLLLIAKYDENKEAVDLDFSCSICCQLDVMKDKKAFVSVERYFESIFRYADENPLEPSLVEFSDLQGGRQILSELKRIVLKALPFDMGDSLERITPHAVTDIAR